MSEMVDKLKEYLANTSPEEVQRAWDETKALDLVGPTVEEFLRLQPAATPWRRYRKEDKETHPQKYGKFLVCRKDGKIHFEVWNNTGFAYNNNIIEFWAEVIPPYQD